VEIASAKLKKYESPGSDQIPAELIQAGGEMLLSEWGRRGTLIEYWWESQRERDH
jgi:hypothetical protein